MSSELPHGWDLSGKVAVVTGAARGIGLSAANLLRSRGAKVVASDVSEDVGELDGDDIATLVGDVSREETAVRTMALARERFGRLDILVNNAGRTMNKPLVETSVADWDSMMETNARGNFLQSREAVKAMIAGAAGSSSASPPLSQASP